MDCGAEQPTGGVGWGAPALVRDGGGRPAERTGDAATVSGGSCCGPCCQPTPLALLQVRAPTPGQCARASEQPLSSRSMMTSV